MILFLRIDVYKMLLLDAIHHSAIFTLFVTVILQDDDYYMLCTSHQKKNQRRGKKINKCWTKTRATTRHLNLNNVCCFIIFVCLKSQTSNKRKKNINNVLVCTSFDLEHLSSNVCNCKCFFPIFVLLLLSLLTIINATQTPLTTWIKSRQHIHKQTSHWFLILLEQIITIIIIFIMCLLSARTLILTIVAVC